MDQVVGTSSPSLGTSSGLDIGGGVDAGCGETTGASVSHGLAGSGSDLSLIDSSIGSGGGVKIYSVIGSEATGLALFSSAFSVISSQNENAGPLICSFSDTGLQEGAGET